MLKHGLFILMTILLFSESLFAQYYGRGRGRSTGESGQSSFYLEAYTGYYKGSIKGTNIENRGLDGDLKSFIAGTRLGIKGASGLIGGIDFAFGKSGSIDTESNAVDRIDYEPLDLGAFVGYQLNENIRLWGSYIFSHKVKLDGDDNGAVALNDMEGDGYNAGISITGIPLVRINLEYHIRKIKEINGSSLNASDNKSSTFLLSLSLPFQLPMSRLTGY